MLRGAFQFDVDETGDLRNTASNVESLRRLWLHPTLVYGDDIGPGDRGDFGVGAWHVSCHLAGAGGVRRGRDRGLLWLEISHDPASDDYYASVTARQGDGGGVRTHRLDSAEGRLVLRDSTLVGFVEGNSVGRISARGVSDPPDRFNLWRRQDFDLPVDQLKEDGGKVWEHWCTLRDIRPPNRFGTSVLTAYVSLVAALGDRFAATVARGRRDYGHPVQLAAMVWAGLVSRSGAVWDTKPRPLSPQAESLLLHAEPGRSLEAVELLDWAAAPRYYMYRRRLDGWSPANQVRKDLEKLKLE